MIVLGIETSCDETAAAVIRDDRTVMSNLVLSQLEEHRAFGGVVPEVAARAHLDHLDTLIKGAMDDAGIGFGDLNGVAATCGPGLIGGVMVGMMAAKAIAAARHLPFIAINHLEAHALTPRLTDDLDFPYLLLLVSGGHTQILVAENVSVYRHWGGTVDDALGECFDKSAKLMGLPYPGGPHLEQTAAQCRNPQAACTRFELPRPMKGRPEMDFSFSGLKTAVRAHVDKLPPGDLRRDDVADLACSFQEAICDVLQDRLSRALAKFKAAYQTGRPALVLAGGVAANLRIRAALTSLAQDNGFRLVAPPVKLCSDNAAMIAWAGIEHLRLGHTHALNVAARPRWPLAEMSETTNAPGR
ncbi:MAG: tRNA (adenosine(37)-N6)-threonylcarbamoyltransferase complex transferase subunit TsaD [Micavibrio aeruginosavorus]|uniref:tRNA N6-adenosine threonylcarbamoyltransferase n=1 Tax=Micavibrio aeruginosavorus TaxID=349221 RepID=A0A7T5R3E7_9BACT|nr:MAG: tRNA (adenosine(37)-N6)-threonylcarbamoyltransferase complex transferase subunit TsaD [Micavibrio aeruginosavorus]